MLFEITYRKPSRIRDLTDFLGLPHLYPVFMKEFRINLRELIAVVYLFLGGANEATPRYPTVDLRVFRV